MAPQTYHLVFRQGTTLIKTFEFFHALKLSKDLLPNAGTPADKIRIIPLTIGLPVGFELIFPQSNGDEIILTLTSPLVAGNSIVNILPYTGTTALLRGSQAKTLPRDLTGQVWSGALKADYRQNGLLQSSFTVRAADGIVIMEASDTATASVRPNCKYDQLPEIGKWQDISSYHADLVKKAYYWDAEYRINGRTFGALQGRCFVYAETTD
jgi:hypothetical protein